VCMPVTLTLRGLKCVGKPAYVHSVSANMFLFTVQVDCCYISDIRLHVVPVVQVGRTYTE
jgi:hypothetical protein